jgi:hypothetical protein
VNPIRKTYSNFDMIVSQWTLSTISSLASASSKVSGYTGAGILAFPVGKAIHPDKMLLLPVTKLSLVALILSFVYFALQI